MTLLIAFALYMVLLHRLDLFSPVKDYREALKFESQVLQLAEDVEWEEQMRQARKKHSQEHPYPMLSFRMSRM
jgi:hypothetical protein